MFETVFIVLLAMFAIGGIWAFVMTKKVKKEGIETEGFISRVELRERSGGTDAWDHGSVSEEYYVTFTNRDGQPVESMLTNTGDHTFKTGDRVMIRYLPERQDYSVLVEVL